MTEKKDRIYIVTNSDGAPVALVRARSKSAAVRSAVARDYRADVATQEELVELAGNGWRVIDASEEPDQDDKDDVTLAPKSDQ